MTDAGNRQERVYLLEKFLDEKILVLDGAMGTAIQSRNLTALDFGGNDLEGCNEYLVVTRPDIICGIHENYLQAGCDIIETNTFGGTPLVLDEYGLGTRAVEINKKAAELALKTALKFSTADKPRFVAGSIGPTTKAISVTGGITFEDLTLNFYAQAKALYEGGVDYFLLETCQDTRNIKAALVAIDRLHAEKLHAGVGLKLPVAVSATIEPTGTMLAGQSVEALLSALSNRELLYLGLNCATGPAFMTDHIRTLAALSPFRVACVPNAGLPDEHGHYLENPQMLADVVKQFIDHGWINLIGGCCGTHAEHIQALVKTAETSKPKKTDRKNDGHSRSELSGIDYLEITDELRPVIVGERTNIIGSRKFKKLICEGKFEEASEIAKAQVKAGAHIIDVCLSNPDRDEMSDLRQFLEFTIKKIKVPLMIDSTNEHVIEMALTYSQGKAIINSINLEDGEDRFEKVIPLARQYGAALVVGTIDDDPVQGMGITRARKLSIAEYSYELLTKKYDVPPGDIYWDPLVFPCATGDAQYAGSAVETIEGLRLIKQKFPNTKTILGVSNVSFGLPEAGREVLNSIFLYHCVQAGLDLAIVNSEKLQRYAGISEVEKKLAEDLLFNRKTEDPILAFANYFREKKPVEKTDRKSIPLSDRLAANIVEGSKDGLIEDLNEAMKSGMPLDIINGPLMKGMDEVGRLFNQNKLIVAEVLQSAEVMKAAVAHLEPFMDKKDSALRGTMLLATVKGDVHDIGKNLVDIIFSNNGFKVINLGIKIPPAQLIAAAIEHKPDIIGLSGLLVKSAQQMVVTAEDLAQTGFKIPILVGGAALSQNFTDRHIAKAYSSSGGSTSGIVAYAKDAMQGLDLAKLCVDPIKLNQLASDLKKRREELERMDRAQPHDSRDNQKVSDNRSASVAVLDKAPSAPDYDRHVLRSYPIEQIWDYINPLMLYTRHLGLQGGIVRKLEQMTDHQQMRKELEANAPKALAIYDLITELKEEYRHHDCMKPVGVYQYFRAASRGNSLLLFDDADKEAIATFNFPRQKQENGLCLSDYVSPIQAQSKKNVSDNIALFLTTVGIGTRSVAGDLKEKGEYLKSYAIAILAIESAEAFAEMLHSQLRAGWGAPDPVEMTMMQRFQARYPGRRYSFGYPACPNLDDQSILFKLLKPEDIGVQLTDGFMMDPESSVSAIAFHHPQATYFSAGQTDENRS